MKPPSRELKTLTGNLFDRFEPLAILSRHLVLFASVAGLILGLAVVAYLVIPVSYVATGTVLVGDPEPGVAQSATDAQKTGDPADMESQLIIVRSQSVLRRALSSPKAQQALRAECVASGGKGFGGNCDNLSNRLDRLADYVSSRYGVGSVGRSRIINIAYTSSEPQVAADMANALIEAFLEEQKDTVSSSRENAAEWLRKEADALDAEIRRLDKQIADYRGENGLVRGSGGPVNSEFLTGVNQQLVAAQAAQATAAARLKEIQAADFGGSPSATAVLDSRTVGDLKQKLAEAEALLATAQTTLGPAHPRLKALQGERNILNERLKAEIGRIVNNAHKQYDAATERVAVLTKQVQTAKAEVTDATGNETSIEDMVRNAEIRRRQFADLATRINDLEVERRVRAGNVRLVSEAEVPLKPFFPKKVPFAAAGLTLGMLFGAVAAFLADKLGSAPSSALAGGNARNRADPRSGFPGGRKGATGGPSFLAQMPFVSSMNWNGKRNSQGSVVDAALADPGARKALAAIGNSVVGRPGRVIALTSGTPGAGKSTLAGALARHCAAIGTNVLVVDGNLQRPRAGELLGAPRGGDWPKQSPQDLILKSAFESLHVIPAGHARMLLPPDHWSEQRMSELLQWARNYYGLVILDGPSFGEAGASAITSIADMTVLCMSPRELETSASDAIISTLRARQANIGIVAIDLRHERKPIDAPPLKRAANQGWR